VLQKHVSPIHVRSSIRIYKCMYLMEVQQFVIYWHLEYDVHIFFMTQINSLVVMGWKTKYCPKLTQVSVCVCVYIYIFFFFFFTKVINLRYLGIIREVVKHQEINLCNGDVLCFLWGRDWIFIYCLEELHLWRVNTILIFHKFLWSVL
jgi:hypothetical protein